ncbi:MAG: NAD-dependent epimerase/dehydratase family protein [Rhodothalassiaceae bacterium]
MSAIAMVTGGCGFIGWHLVQQLVARGWQVRVVDPAPLPQTIDGVTHMATNLADADSLAAAAQGARWVFHLAAITHLWQRDPRCYAHVNVAGTSTLLSCLARSRPEAVVHTSTEVILRGWNDPDPSAIAEDQPLPPLTAMAGPYTRSKWRAEQLARAAAAAGVPVRIVYPTIPVGPGDRGLTPPSKMLADLIAAPPPAYLPCLFNMAPVADVAAAHLLAAEHGRTGDRFLLGGSHLSFEQVMDLVAPYTAKPMPRRQLPYWLANSVARLAGGVAAATGQPPVASLEGVRLVKYARRIDSSHAKTRLGWRAGPVEPALCAALTDGSPETG